MLILHRPILADDPDLVLRYERGLFEVVSPQGDTVRVTCPSAVCLKVANAVNQDCAPHRRWWRIEKLSEA